MTGFGKGALKVEEPLFADVTCTAIGISRLTYKRTTGVGIYLCKTDSMVSQQEEEINENLDSIKYQIQNKNVEHT